jgi:signal peptidase I
MFKIFGNSKLIKVSSISLILWFLSLCTFVWGAFATQGTLLKSLMDPVYAAHNVPYLVMIFSIILGIIPFIVGILCLSLGLAKGKKSNKSSIKGIIISVLKFFLIFLILPFYSFRQLVKQNKSGLFAKLRILVAAVFLTLTLVPIWMIVFLLVVGYPTASAFGYSPTPVLESGTGSMYPTFPKGDGKTDIDNSKQIVGGTLFNRYQTGFELFGKGYFKQNLERGDIVSFRNQTTDELTKKQLGKASSLVKRLIALPGDTLELRGGVVYLNGSPLNEPYTASPQSTFSEGFVAECTKITIPQEKIFVMGDNRKGSGDSREFGFVDINDIQSLLTLNAQKGQLEKNWRDTSHDLAPQSAIQVDKNQYLALLNAKRKEAGAPELKYVPVLEKSAQSRGEYMLKNNNFIDKNSRYNSREAMNDAGYSNPVVGESNVQGYFTAEELIEDQFAFPDTQSFLMDKQYTDIGISEVQGEVNGCPTQVIVLHFGGYVPPNYKQSDTKSWLDSVEGLKKNQPGWNDLKNNQSFYQNHKADVDRINEIIAIRISNNSEIAAKMQANQWLTPAEQKMADGDKALYDEQESIAARLNSSGN